MPGVCAPWGLQFEVIRSSEHGHPASHAGEPVPRPFPQTLTFIAGSKVGRSRGRGHRAVIPLHVLERLGLEFGFAAAAARGGAYDTSTFLVRPLALVSPGPSRDEDVSGAPPVPPAFLPFSGILDQPVLKKK